MKVEIWSDVVCPFCYIGKRKFENALEQFEHKSQVQVKWHSFQLSPDAQYVSGKSIHDVLADKKGWSHEKARRINAQVTEMAKEENLNFDFDKVKPANTFDAHRLIHLADRYNLQQEAEERLFSAYFTEGKNISNKETLIKLGIEIGLPEQQINNMLLTDSYVDEVKTDEYEAQQIGIRGVPFFVIDRKWAVSGAQPKEVFLEALQKAWKEWEKENPAIAISRAEQNTCSLDGNC